MKDMSSVVVFLLFAAKKKLFFFPKRDFPDGLGTKLKCLLSGVRNAPFDVLFKNRL